MALTFDPVTLKMKSNQFVLIYRSKYVCKFWFHIPFRSSRATEFTINWFPYDRRSVILIDLLAYDLEKLKTFPAMPTHMMDVCAKFHWNSSTKNRDISRHMEEMLTDVGPKRSWTHGRTDMPTDGWHQTILKMIPHSPPTNIVSGSITKASSRHWLYQ